MPGTSITASVVRFQRPPMMRILAGGPARPDEPATPFDTLDLPVELDRVIRAATAGFSVFASTRLPRIGR
jgi:hypothetical protein